MIYPLWDNVLPLFLLCSDLLYDYYYIACHFFKVISTKLVMRYETADAVFFIAGKGFYHDLYKRFNVWSPHLQSA